MQEILKQDKDKADKKYGSFEKLLSEDLSNRSFRENEIVKGTVEEIGKKWIYISVGLKSSGRVSLDEYKLTNELNSLKVGDSTEVLLERLEDRNGEMVISREKARRTKNWNKLKISFDKKEHVTGKIVGSVKGGYACSVNSVLAFLPQSQVDIRPTKNIKTLMNTEQTFEIVKMDKKRGNVVLSRRSVIESERNKDRDKIISKIKVGQIVEGIVKNITQWGSFIDIAGVDALLHITDCSHQRINKPSDLMSVGDTIKCIVTRIDENKKISVSIKDLTENPWLSKVDAYKVKGQYDAVVTRVMNYGVFAKLDDTVEGLIHSTQLHWVKKNVHPGKILSVSESIKVEILEIDKQKKRLSLSYKNCFENPWKIFAKNVKVNDVLDGVIKSVMDYGLFISINDKNGKPTELEGLCHIKNVHYDLDDSHLKNYKKNMPVKFVVLDFDVKNEKIQLGIKQLKTDSYSFFLDKKISDTITVTVDRADQKGVWVNAGPKNFPILIKRTQLALEPENQRISRFQRNDKLDVAITELKKDQRLVQVSIKELEKQHDALMVKKYGSKDSGGVLSDLFDFSLLKSKKQKNKK